MLHKFYDGNNMKSDKLLAHPHQTLAVHLIGVAEKAKDFAKVFKSEEHAEIAGLLHDLGKAEDVFQSRMAQIRDCKRDTGEKQPHAPHGAALALERHLWPVAFSVYGHHAGLHNRSDLQRVHGKWINSANVCVRRLKSEGVLSNYPSDAFDNLGTLPAWLEALPATTSFEKQAKLLSVEFYSRMLFSALVDADRLDTEETDSAESSRNNSLRRKGWRFGPKALGAGKETAQNAEPPSILLEALYASIEDRVENARKKGASPNVMSVRDEVLKECREKATKSRGVFSLTVPTGGGKTLSSFAFALEHIQHHNQTLAENDPNRLRRIIIVLPFLNIIQQTSEELKEIFNHSDEDPLILEHHSQATDPPLNENAIEQGKTSDYSYERSLRQLAAENWDAPVIVTTSVQFFDSLFSRRPSDARKLHNICQSVLIFDEVQTLPPLLLQPILDALKELTSPERPYRCSALLCTATQPALLKSDDMEFGFEKIEPIIHPSLAREHFEKLDRVQYHNLSKENDPPVLSHGTLADRIIAGSRKQALVIFNTRQQARDLFELIVSRKREEVDFAEAIFHLSTWMYPAHRILVLKKVRDRLERNLPCILISTQCVEAGVDVDFPVVFRAFGPYDSMVQAAGRCNRSGALPDGQKGDVFIFKPEDGNQPIGTYETAIANSHLLRRMGRAFPSDPNSFNLYFRLFYQASVPDLGGCAVQSAREKLHFKQVSELFRFIDTDTVPILIESVRVPGANEDTLVKFSDEQTIQNLRLVAQQRNGGNGFFTPDEWRRIQPFIVNLNYPTSRKLKEFFEQSDTALVFKGDDLDRGLRFLKCGALYLDGPHGAGLNLSKEALQNLGSDIL